MLNVGHKISAAWNGGPRDRDQKKQTRNPDAVAVGNGPSSPEIHRKGRRLIVVRLPVPAIPQGSFGFVATGHSMDDADAYIDNQGQI